MGGGLLLREGRRGGTSLMCEHDSEGSQGHDEARLTGLWNPEIWAPDGDNRIPVEVCGRSRRGRGRGSEHVHADLSVALGTCDSSHLDTVGSKGDCPSLWLSWDTVSEHTDPMRENGAELYQKPFMVLEVERDWLVLREQSEGERRCSREQKAGTQEVNGGGISCV